MKKVWLLALTIERYCQGIVMMCIQFIYMFMGLPSWVCVVCGLVVCWLKNIPFSFILVSLFPALSESCIALFRCSCAHLEEMYPGRSEGCGVLCKRQQSFDVFDTSWDFFNFYVFIVIHCYVLL